MRSGCKGCTTYRPNDVTGSVLSVEEPKDAIPAEAVIAPATRANRNCRCRCQDPKLGRIPPAAAWFT